jgi:hypothetical protein
MPLKTNWTWIDPFVSTSRVGIMGHGYVWSCEKIQRWRRGGLLVLPGEAKGSCGVLGLSDKVMVSIAYGVGFASCGHVGRRRDCGAVCCII